LKGLFGMTLSTPFKNKTYNLPWASSLKVAIWITIIFSFLPDFPKFPIGSIFGAGVILYFAIFIKGPNQLGMSLKLPRKALRAIMILLVIFVAINIAIMMSINAVKDYAVEHPEEAPFLEEMIEYDYGYYWKPDSTLYYSLSQKNLKGTIFALRVPLLQQAILGPVFETIIFFAVLFPAIWKKLSYIAALWISMGVFVLGHFPAWTIEWVICLFVFAYIMAKLYAKTGSIYPSILFHSCINLTMDILYFSLNWGLPYKGS
jgi:membrane protease YdiL (CAAX protease family)